MRYGANHKTETRRRLLKEAAKQIRERGPHAIALAGIMAEAGLTHGGFYAHFTSKQDFLSAAVEQMFVDSPASLLRTAQDGRSARDVLLAFVELYLSPEHRDTRTEGCPLPFLASDAPRLPPDLHDRLSRGIAAMIERVAYHLTAMGHTEADLEASSCVSEIIGAVILSRAEPDRERADAILARSRASVRRRLDLEHCD